MKRIALFGLFALLSICQLRANYYKAGSITYYYTVGSGEAYVSSADKDIVTATILASFQATDQVWDGEKYVNRTYTYKVTRVGKGAFEDCKALTSVDLRNCTSIGSWAFQSCSALTSVDLRNCTSIEKEAFEYCKALTNIDLSNCTNIAEYAFSGCTALTSVDISNCTNIGYAAFSGCTALTSVGDISNCSFIGEQAFCNDVALTGKQTTVAIDGLAETWNMLDLSNVETIGPMAFENCCSLDSIDLGVHITKIQKNATIVTNSRGEEKRVMELTYSMNSNAPRMKQIGGAAFRGCKRLKGVSLPKTLEKLGNQCFQNCTSLKTAVIFDAAIDIENNTFNGCTSLEVFVPGKRIKNIQNEAFYNCKSLKVVNVTDIKGIIDKLAFGNCPFKDVYYGNGTVVGEVGHTKAYWSFAQADAENDAVADGPVLIINSHSEIAADALKGTPWMNENKEVLLYLAGNLIKYSPKDEYAYADITVAEGTHTIGDEVFRRKRLNSISLPTGLRTIRSSAFESCSLPTITLPETMSRIDEFAFYNCTALTEIYSNALEPPVADKAFNTYTATLYVPEGCGDAYAQAEGWKGFTNIVEAYGEKAKLLVRYDSLMLAAKTELQAVLTATQSIDLIKSVSQLSSPYTEPSEGSLAALIDGNTNTFWHSIWRNGSEASGIHYLQVDLTSKNKMNVSVTFTRRQTASDHVTRMSIYGTDDFSAAKPDCEELLTFDCPYGSNTETITSDMFNTKGYQYLRLYANKTTSERGYWHLSELQIRSNVVKPGTASEMMNTAAYTNLQNVVNDQALLKRYAIGETEYNALKDAYDAYMQKLAELTDVIVEVGTDDRASDTGVFYTTSGVRMTNPQPGIGIIRYRNGEVRKIMMK